MLLPGLTACGSRIQRFIASASLTSVPAASVSRLPTCVRSGPLRPPASDLADDDLKLIVGYLRSLR